MAPSASTLAPSRSPLAPRPRLPAWPCGAPRGTPRRGASGSRSLRRARHLASGRRPRSSAPRQPRPLLFSPLDGRGVSCTADRCSQSTKRAAIVRVRRVFCQNVKKTEKTDAVVCMQSRGNAGKGSSAGNTVQRGVRTRCHGTFFWGVELLKDVESSMITEGRHFVTREYM